MKVISGDLIKLSKTGIFDVIIHGCNCFCKMRSGIAPQIAKEFPNNELQDAWTIIGDKNKLGTINYVKYSRNTINENIPYSIYVVNAYTQYNYGTDKINVSYDAIRSCFKHIKEKFIGLRIAYPKIGCGLAGGDWTIVSKIIDEELQGEDYTFVEYVKE